MQGGVVLVNTSLMAVGSNVSPGVVWTGGQGCLVLNATQLPPVITLMLNSVGVAGTAVKVNSGALAAVGVYPMPLPPGNYSIHTATGSSISLYAALMPLP